jgi:hypothetical protein
VPTHPNVLNGKYAAIIFRDYVASAAAAATIQGMVGAEVATEE